MSRAASTFRQGDLKRALKATRDAGMDVARVEIGPDGRIVIWPGQAQRAGADQAHGGGAANPWDDAL